MSATDPTYALDAFEEMLEQLATEGLMISGAEALRCFRLARGTGIEEVEEPEPVVDPYLVIAPGIQLMVNGADQAEIVAKTYRQRFGDAAVTVRRAEGAEL